jgi:adenylate kinase family enzyme
LQRVAVIGCAGSGKSTLARQVAAALDLPLVSLDAEYWSPGWIPTADAEWDRRHDELVAADRWVIDGNYSRTIAARLARVDAVVWLDLPTPVCLVSVLRRIAANYGQVRPESAPGCPEKIDFEFLRYVLTFRRIHRPRIAAALDDLPGVVLLRITSRRDAAQVVAALVAQMSPGSARERRADRLEDV